MGFEQNAKIADSRPDLLFIAACRALFWAFRLHLYKAESGLILGMAQCLPMHFSSRCAFPNPRETKDDSYLQSGRLL
jgi:hypothetical protein